jgi:hypothetical protein
MEKAYTTDIYHKSTSSIFAPGKTIFEADLEVKGVHNGK